MSQPTGPAIVLVPQGGFKSRGNTIVVINPIEQGHTGIAKKDNGYRTAQDSAGPLDEHEGSMGRENPSPEFHAKGPSRAKGPCGHLSNKDAGHVNGKNANVNNKVEVPGQGAVHAMNACIGILKGSVENPHHPNTTNAKTESGTNRPSGPVFLTCILTHIDIT